jgi:hypothetical protein
MLDVSMTCEANEFLSGVGSSLQVDSLGYKGGEFALE